MTSLTCSRYLLVVAARCDPGAPWRCVRCVSFGASLSLAAFCLALFPLSPRKAALGPACVVVKVATGRWQAASARELFVCVTFFAS